MRQKSKYSDKPNVFIYVLGKEKSEFARFSCSVNDLNLSTDFNFFYWKNYLFRLLTSTVVASPFTWMLADR